MPLDFGELPPTANHPDGVIDWSAAAAELRTRPGEWARIYVGDKPKKAHTAASNLRRGILSAFRPAGSFEAHARAGDVWARYVGSEQ